MIEQILVFPFDNEERLFVEVEVDTGGHVLIPEAFDLFVGGTCVGFGFEVEFGESESTDVLHLKII